MEADIREVRIERYYPSVLANAKEFKEIAMVVNPELKIVWKALWKQFLNTFVYSLDIDGAKRWESMLKLYPVATDSLETRRKRILTKINAVLPYTERTLQSMLDGIYGEEKTEVSIKYNDYELWVDVLAAFLFKSQNMRVFLRAIIPANLSIAVSNTQTAKLNLYCGVTMQKFKHITILPSVTFSIANDSTTKYVFGGGVKRMIHITLRS